VVVNYVFFSDLFVIKDDKIVFHQELLWPEAKPEEVTPAMYLYLRGQFENPGEDGC
jgi:hypothetical protein